MTLRSKLDFFENKIDNTKKDAVNNLISDIRANISSENLDVLKPQIDELQKLMGEIGSELYNEQTTSETNETNSNDNDSVIDTDFQE